MDLFDTRTGAVLGSFDAPELAKDMAFTPDGKFLTVHYWPNQVRAVHYRRYLP